MKAYYEYCITVGNDPYSNSGGVIKDSIEECIDYCRWLITNKYCCGDPDKFDNFAKEQKNLWVSITVKSELFPGYIDINSLNISDDRLKSLINLYAIDYQYNFKTGEMYRYEINKYKDITIYGDGTELEYYFDKTEESNNQNE